MSEDKLERALEAMKGENPSPEQIAGARARVWERLGIPGLSACVEIRPAFRDYLSGRLGDNQRLLMEDHLSRCPQCRTQLADLKGERKVIAMPLRRDSWWPRWRAWAVAAILVVMVLYLGRDRMDTLLAPSGPRASVASVTGTLYRVPEGVLRAGESLVQNEVVRTGPSARALLRLTDGSLVEVNELTELSVRAAWSGQTIHLQRGDIIVQATKQHHGRLQVQTRDSLASVKGTVFAVSSGLAGTVVSVVEGSVAVVQPGTDVVLNAGEQVATKTALAHSVRDSVSWSPDAEKYAALLASFAGLEKEIAKLPSQGLRTQPRLLQYLPENAVIYGAIPNLGGTIRQAMALSEQQSADNPAFREWWNSSAGQDLRLLIERIQTVTPLLGDEIVYVVSANTPGAKVEIPMIVAEVQPARHDELESALEALRGQEGNTPLSYSLTGTLAVVSDSQEHLQWVLGRMGHGVDTPFATEIAARYQRGIGWLLGIDIRPALSAISGGTEAGLIGAQQMKYLFLEQREIQGVDENEVSLTFTGARMGMTSWLASAGSGGAAEYLSSDAAFAIYASTREPRQLFEEITAQLAKLNPSAGGNFAEAEAKLGAGFARDLVAAFGTESAFALNGLSATGPVWVMAVLVNNPSTLDYSIHKLVDVFDAELAPEDQVRRITISQETADGRIWNTMKSNAFPLSVTWTYDNGYLIAASDRGAGLRAIAARNGGSALVRLTAFQQQMPFSVGLHPSAFAWLNTKGALEGFAALVPNPTFLKLIAERDPILVVFDGTTEQIHSASRTRISGLIVDMMLLESLSSARGGSQSSILQHGSPGMR